MAFLLVLLLFLVTLHNAWPNPLGCEPAASWLIVWSGIALLWLATDLFGRLACRALRRAPDERAGVMRLYFRWKRWHGWCLIGFFLIALYVFGWGATIHQMEEAWRVPGFKVVVLTPVLAGLMLSWLRQYDVERLNFEIAHYPERTLFVGRLAFLGMQARHNFLFVLPLMLVLVVQQSLVILIPELLLSIGMLAVALIVIPYFLRLFLGLQPLPDGPLRQRLMATAARLRFRVTDVLVWNTRNGVANAMVTGVLPWLRYVVVTDRLLEDLNEDEIEAVFGHEVGHMKHHHMFFYMVFVLTSLMLLGGLWSAGNWWFEHADIPEWLGSLVGVATWHTIAVWAILGIVAAYILVVFGWLSRRCERQADIFGAKTTSPAAFVSALEKVADLNGIPRERPGFLSWWQHSTIADRIDFIRRMEADPRLEPTFQRRLGWVKWGLALGLIALVVLFRSWWEWDLTKLL
ncbi:MAG: M48 family metallopeptidase [Gemmataceae bacterium]|nr:M48 family metallopeptidase [Gemmataceae bacterium]